MTLRKNIRTGISLKRWFYTGDVIFTWYPFTRCKKNGWNVEIAAKTYRNWGIETLSPHYESSDQEAILRNCTSGHAITRTAVQLHMSQCNYTTFPQCIFKIKNPSALLLQSHADRPMCDVPGWHNSHSNTLPAEHLLEVRVQQHLRCRYRAVQSVT